MTEAAAGRTGCEFGAPVWWMLLSGCFRRAQATSRADRETRCMDSKARKQECLRRALQPPTIMWVSLFPEPWEDVAKTPPTVVAAGY